MKINQNILNRFKNTVWDYYKRHKRNLPWRDTTDPYRILVSEVMLQQTQVSRVLIKYGEFIGKFPDFSTLAKSTTHDVLFVWSGMGYNRRALYLQKIAQIIIKKYKGAIPPDPHTLDSLPGIGISTACAVITYAFNTPTVFIETNIRRVFIHHFFPEEREVDDREIYPLVEQTVDPVNPREWYYALMDYGSYLARTTENPNRKSKHYAIQAPFEGSNRQIRGRILRLLLKKPLQEAKIIEEMGENEDRVRRILQELAKDGFIRAQGNTYTIG